MERGLGLKSLGLTLGGEFTFVRRPSGVDGDLITFESTDDRDDVPGDLSGSISIFSWFFSLKSLSFSSGLKKSFTFVCLNGVLLNPFIFSSYIGLVSTSSGSRPVKLI